jgi:hypothetical protein
MAGEPIRCPEFHNRDYWVSGRVTRDLVLLARSGMAENWAVLKHHGILGQASKITWERPYSAPP